MILPIKIFPDDVLRRPTEPVVFPLSKDLQKLTKDMIETVRAADGIGLAAPQVGRSVKLIIVNLEKSGVPLMALYNPKIVGKGFKKTEIEEGCLSIPQVFGMVKRPQKVTIEAQNAEGKIVKFIDEGWVSRVAQHEIDHINGRLIIDLIKKYTQGEDLVKGWRKQKLI
ncbi:MAG: peptide deformylase [Candidatus Doudnabacteria bacterium]|nr:peptide deformylase [Candidatus Doudnabacteria bacterium]